MKVENGRRLIVALDLPSREQVYEMFGMLYPVVTFFKLGLEAYSACGPDIVKRIKESGARVFLDLKFHDIPRTVHRACLAALELGVDMMNVHASGGRRMMEAAAEAREIWRAEEGKSMDGDTFPAIIGVTLLTHLCEEEYLDTFGSPPIGPTVFVERLARMAKESGLQGVVSSGREARVIREKVGKDFLIVTPGVRPAGTEDGGHARRVTPAEALSNGSDFIVVGRPITRASEPVRAAEMILREMGTS